MKFSVEEVWNDSIKAVVEARQGVRLLLKVEPCTLEMTFSVIRTFTLNP